MALKLDTLKGWLRDNVKYGEADKLQIPELDAAVVAVKWHGGKGTAQERIKYIDLDKERKDRILKQTVKIGPLGRLTKDSDFANNKEGAVDAIYCVACKEVLALKVLVVFFLAFVSSSRTLAYIPHIPWLGSQVIQHSLWLWAESGEPGSPEQSDEPRL